MREGSNTNETLGRIEIFMKHIGERLQRLEEIQKKSSGEERNENDEWEDAHRGDYEKFTEEIKGKIELMHQTLRKNQGFND